MRHTALSLQSKVKFPPSMADVRDFEVRTRDNNEKVGKVSDLVCGDDGQIRYLDVGLGGLFNTKRVLLPVGVARVDRTNDVVWVAGMTKEQVKQLPDYNGDPATITDTYESECCGPYLGHVSAAGATKTTPADLYDQGRFYADRGGAAAREGRVAFGDGDDVGLSGAAGHATSSGRLDRLAGRADDLGERVDANPRSRPGPDSVDQRM